MKAPIRYQPRKCSLCGTRPACADGYGITCRECTPWQLGDDPAPWQPIEKDAAA